MFFLERFARFTGAAALLVIQTYSVPIPAETTALDISPTTTSPDSKTSFLPPTPTSGLALCKQVETVSSRYNACFDFVMRYSSTEYQNVLELPDRVEVVTSYDELIRCLREENLCDDSDRGHYLILLDRDNASFSTVTTSPTPVPDIYLLDVQGGIDVDVNVNERSYAIKPVIPSMVI